MGRRASRDRSRSKTYHQRREISSRKNVGVPPTQVTGQTSAVQEDASALSSLLRLSSADAGSLENCVERENDQGVVACDGLRRDGGALEVRGGGGNRSAPTGSRRDGQVLKRRVTSEAPLALATMVAVSLLLGAAFWTFLAVASALYEKAGSASCFAQKRREERRANRAAQDGAGPWRDPGRAVLHESPTASSYMDRSGDARRS